MSRKGHIKEEFRAPSFSAVFLFWHVLTNILNHKHRSTCHPSDDDFNFDFDYIVTFDVRQRSTGVACAYRKKTAN